MMEFTSMQRSLVGVNLPSHDLTYPKPVHEIGCLHLDTGAAHSPARRPSTLRIDRPCPSRQTKTRCISILQRVLFGSMLATAAIPVVLTELVRSPSFPEWNLDLIHFGYVSEAFGQVVAWILNRRCSIFVLSFVTSSTAYCFVDIVLLT